MANLNLNIGAQQVQKQSLVITPQLQHAISLLQMNNLELEKHIEEMAESNPFLEVKSPNSETFKNVAIDTRSTTSYSSEFSGSLIDKLVGEKPLTLIEYLEKQIRFHKFSAKQYFISQIFIMDLSKAGYFQGNFQEISEKFKVPIEELEDVFKILQSLEPSGIFARNLSECLKIQAIDLNEYTNEMEIVLNNLPLLAKGQFKELCNLAKCDLDKIKEIALKIRRYNPKPGNVFIETPLGEAREPDLVVTRNKNEVYVHLNRSTLPSVKINLEYASMLKDQISADDTSKEFVNHSIATGHWLKRAIAQRNQTLQSVATCIFKHQFAFFDRGIEGIRPLQLRVIADSLGIHESTVSRSTASVLVQTPLGTLPLKMFFSSGLRSEESEEGISARAIRLKIREIVDSENPQKPISDAQISKLLEASGYRVARRTVAKYRDLESIKSTSQRKREFQLLQLVQS